MKRRTVDPNGSFSKWIRSVYGKKPVNAIARIVAEEARDPVHARTAPIDLQWPLYARRIERVSTLNGSRGMAMAQDGRLIRSDNGFIIEVKAAPLGRRRFTVAHELGHTFLYDITKTPPQRFPVDAVGDDEETFCDLVASEMLMPPAVVVDFFDGTIHSHAPGRTVAQLARSFSVSVEAMARRVVEDIQLLPGIMLGLRWQASRREQSSGSTMAWRLAWSAVSPSLMADLYLPPAAAGASLKLPLLDDMYQDGADDVCVVQAKCLQLGNLGRVVSKLDDLVSLSVSTIRPTGVQLSFNGLDEPPDQQMKKRSNLIMYIPLESKVSTAESVHPPA